MRSLLCWYATQGRLVVTLPMFQDQQVVPKCPWLMTNLYFMFCWPCILIYSFKNKSTWCTIYLKHISSNTSTCFRHIYSPSSGGTPYGYNNWYLFFFLDVCLLYPYGCTSWRWAVDTPETCRGVWRNVLEINCASSWFFFKWPVYTEEQRLQY